MKSGRSLWMRSRKPDVLAAVFFLLAVFPRVAILGAEPQTQVQSESQGQSGSSIPFVMQGEITAIEGDLLTVKMPNGYPAGNTGGNSGGTSVHPMYVTAGPSLRIDISHARVLMPDGRQEDKRPLAIGERVVMVMLGSGGGAAVPITPRSVYQTRAASVIERVLQGDKVVTH